jgi:hypothetical protein
LEATADDGIWRTRELGGGVGGGIWQRGEEAVAVVLVGMELVSRRRRNFEETQVNKTRGNLRLIANRRASLLGGGFIFIHTHFDMMIHAIQHLCKFVIS